MKSIKVTLISTLKNEESTIDNFLKSLLNQSRKPDEIVIVDGGSTDRTPEIINSFIEAGSPIELIIDKDANIARGRNIAINKSKYSYIACADAGCKLDKNWLKNLTQQFEQDDTVDIVSGFYLPDSHTLFEECIAEVTYTKLKNITVDDFLPSSRSLAFKKTIWERVGGYPEWLYTAEDTLFDLNIKNSGAKFALATDAIVYWRPRQTMKQLIKQRYLYGKGDGEARIYLKIYTIKSFVTLAIVSLAFVNIIYSAYLIFLLIFMRSFPHLTNSTYIINSKFKHPKVFILIPAIICCAEASNLLGFYRGLITHLMTNSDQR